MEDESPTLRYINLLRVNLNFFEDFTERIVRQRKVFTQHIVYQRNTFISNKGKFSLVLLRKGIKHTNNFSWPVTV